MIKSNVLFVNHKQQRCGIYQYGYRSGQILNSSKLYNFLYIEVESEIEFLNSVKENNPVVVIYNYYLTTMNWLDRSFIKRLPNIIHCGLYHEGNLSDQFDYLLFVDPTHIDTHNSFSIPRPLFETNFSYSKPNIPIINSFGFGFEHKGFEKIVKLVNEQFDEAIIRLHISSGFYADKDGARAAGVADRCRNEMKKSNIQLTITHDFLTDTEILNFLGKGTLNIFLYDKIYGFPCGVSSVIDYALSVEVPIAISDSNMFRHIQNEKICVNNKSLIEIINDKNNTMLSYRNLWSKNNFIGKYEGIISIVNSKTK